MKEPFKLNRDFHNSFTESLDRIAKGTEVKPYTLKKAASVAASLIIIAAAAVFGAEAAGVIDLKSAFRMTPAKNPDLSMSVVPQISDNEIAESISSGVTAKVLQTMVYDFEEQTDNFVIIELSADDKVLNPGMMIISAVINAPGDQNINPSEIYSVSVLQDYEFDTVYGIEELQNILSRSAVPNGTYTSDDMDNFMSSVNRNYRDSFTDKIYVAVHFNGNYTNKEICLSFSNLHGLKENAVSPEDLEPAINGTWELSFVMNDNAKTSHFTIEKEYNGVYYEEISVSPISISGVCPDISGIDFGDTCHINAVRLKDGSIQPVTPVGSTGSGNTFMYYFNNLLDINNISGVFIGESCTEIPFQ